MDDTYPFAVPCSWPSHECSASAKGFDSRSSILQRWLKLKLALFKQWKFFNGISRVWFVNCIAATSDMGTSQVELTRMCNRSQHKSFSACFWSSVLDPYVQSSEVRFSDVWFLDGASSILVYVFFKFHLSCVVVTGSCYFSFNIFVSKNFWDHLHSIWK